MGPRLAHPKYPNTYLKYAAIEKKKWRKKYANNFKELYLSKIIIIIPAIIIISGKNFPQ